MFGYHHSRRHFVNPKKKTSSPPRKQHFCDILRSFSVASYFFAILFTSVATSNVICFPMLSNCLDVLKFLRLFKLFSLHCIIIQSNCQKISLNVFYIPTICGQIFLFLPCNAALLFGVFFRIANGVV